MPALLTTTSGVPTWAKAASTWARSPTSQAMPPGEGWRDRSKTVQPSSRKRATVAAPMPLLPPVTTTVLPERPFMGAPLYSPAPRLVP